MTTADPAPDPTPRAAAARSKTRGWLIGASALLGVVVAGALVSTAFTPDTPVPATTTVTTTAAPTATSTPPPPTPRVQPAQTLAPGEVVITSREAGISLFEAPGAEEPIDHLTRWTALGSPTTLLGFERVRVGEDHWVQVERPGAPNHREAWVRVADVTLSSTTTRIDIYLDERELDLSLDGEVQLTHTVAIGALESPTPLGVFWVTDPLDFTANPSGVYGAYALGMNGWSETLDTFNGGPPQLAIHGTNEPQLLGKSVSNGCIRLPNDVMVEVADAAPAGTPVVVHQSRTA